ncbi:hypothetical protein CVV26_02750 [Candidatus Kuenenbacteria bacterium HGW-Kuenenbacteria-1]|uniref:TrbC/VIRB2 family protein n=1 Tax=Candidatus Kuenenbacteria bacterium HGW-Kuenenbacteria-1 TaxID=2013812 RepID=A0A2N1UN60_9BACT|nr:MAG: hypothetical protein CVV26_02750 [Candidatus Kuenenbacteria bacterium HGW-Kuenenbacteria-1]
MKKTIFFFLILFIFFSFVPVIQIVSAEGTALNDPLSLDPNNPVNDLAGRIIKVVLSFVGIITLIMIIYGGLVWMTSGGAEEKIKKGKGILVWAILGLIVVLGSYVLVNFFITSITKVT